MRSCGIQPREASRQFGDAVTFAVFYRNAENRQRWHKIGRFGVWTPDQARKEAQRILRARDLGEDPTAERVALRNALTMAALYDEYVADMEVGKIAGKKAIKSDVSRITTPIEPALGQRKVTAITADDVERFTRSTSSGSARRVTGLLGAISISLLTQNGCGSCLRLNMRSYQRHSTMSTR